MEHEHRLWAAVLCQAYDDLKDEVFQSYWFNQAAAFFFSPDQGWRESRRDVADFLGLDPADLTRPALRILNRRRLDHGLPPLQPRTARPPAAPCPPKQRVSEPAAARARTPLPRLVAIPDPLKQPPQRRVGGARTWRARYAFNPFAPLAREAGSAAD